jgi:myosin heavy subunit
MRKIHLASLLHNVEHRFLGEKVYSYIGNMLLAINPYRNLTMPIPGHKDPCGYYDGPVRAYYASMQGETRQQGVRAHIFVVADGAYRALSAEVCMYVKHLCCM